MITLNPNPIEDHKRRNKLKKNLLEKLESTTIHAIPNIIRSEFSIVKLMWFIFFCFSTSLCIWNIVNMVSDYFSWGVTTTVEYLNDDGGVLFPAVEFCNSNLYTTPYAVDLVLNYLSNITNTSYSSSMNMSKVDYVNMRFFNDPTLEFYMKTYTNGLNSTIKKKLGFTIDNVMISCFFGAVKCTSADFNWNFRKDYGNCFTFNLKNLTYYSLGAGEPYKLKLELYAGLENNFINSNDQNHGFKLLIYNQSNFFLIKDYGINVGAGQSLTLSLNRVIDSKLKKPYSACDFVESTDLSTDEFDLTIFNMFMSVNKTYSLDNCLRVCYRHTALSVCNCFDDILKPIPENTTMKLCSTAKELSCVDNLLTEIVMKKNPIYNCSKFCPVECVRYYFTFNSYYTMFPKTSYANLWLNNKTFYLGSNTIGRPLTVTEFKQNLVQLNIYYNSLSYQYLTQSETTPFVSLISNIGGVLGLFIGMSVLSFVEIFEIFMELVLVLLFNKDKKVNAK